MTEASIRKFVRGLIQERLAQKRRSPRLVDILFEKAKAGSVETDKFPMALSAVNPELATKLVQTGLHDDDPADDIIAVGDGSYSAKDLSPSQTSMDVHKAWWFALGMINGTMYGSGGPGGDIGAFISNDNYIMDGHHRWIATAMANPGAPIKGIKVDFPGEKLVPVLNAATVGLLGIEQGKPGSGGFDQFQKQAAMKKALTLITQDNAPDGKEDKEGLPTSFTGVAGATKEGKAMEVVEEWTGKEGEEAIDAAVKMAMDNLSKVPGSKGAGAVMPGAPDRIDMPVIDDKYAKRNKPAVANVKKALETGAIDVNPGYGELPEEGEGEDEGEEKAEEKVKGESRLRIHDDMVMERWQRLAGLLTD